MPKSWSAVSTPEHRPCERHVSATIKRLLPAIFAAVLLLAANPLQAQVWYRSNASGVRLERIVAAERNQHDWVLRVTSDSNRTEKQLLQRGVEVETIVTQLGSDGARLLEERRVGGALQSRARFSVAGVMIEEENYADDGEVTERYQYQYDGARRTLTRYFEAGEAVYTDRYSYGIDGMLREVRREYVDNTSRSSRFLFIRGLLTEEQHEVGSRVDRIRYDHLGRVELTQRLRDDEPVVTTDFTFEGDRHEPVLSVTADRSTGTSTVDAYDSIGRVVRSRTSSSTGDLLIGVDREFGDHGVVLELRTDPAGRRSKRFFYDEAGTLLSEEHRLNERLQTRILYTGNGSRKEERFRAGELILRLYYQDDRITAQEVIRDGEVVRSR